MDIVIHHYVRLLITRNYRINYKVLFLNLAMKILFMLRKIAYRYTPKSYDSSYIFR